MRKLHVLIPSLVSASTLPALTIVSCGNNWTSQWSIGDGEFKWTHELATGTVNSEDEATGKYFNEIDTKQFADDLLKYGADSVLIHPECYSKYELDVKVTKIDKEEHRISIVIHTVRERNDEDNETSMNITITYNNFPVKLFLHQPLNSDLDNYWKLAQVEMHLTNRYTLSSAVIPKFYREDTNWSYSVVGDSDGKILNDTIDYRTSGQEKSHAEAVYLCFYEEIMFSWYFQNVSMNN